MATDDSSITSVVPLNYADLALPRRPRRYVVYANISWFMCAAMLLMGTAIELFSIGNMREITRGNAYLLSEAQREVASAKLSMQQPPPQALTQDEISKVLARIVSQTSNPRQRHPGLPTDAQTASIKRILSTPGQLMIEPSLPLGRSSAGDQWVGAGLEPDGTLSLGVTYDRKDRFAFAGNGGYRTKIAPDGTNKGTPYIQSATEQMAQAQADLTATTTNEHATRAAEYGDSEVAAVAGALQLVLAVFLGIAALVLLRRGSQGVKLHRIYGVLQIILSLCIGGSLMQMISAGPADMLSYLGALPAIIGCIYPIAILAGLRVPQSPQSRTDIVL